MHLSEFSFEYSAFPKFTLYLQQTLQGRKSTIYNYNIYKNDECHDQHTNNRNLLYFGEFHCRDLLRSQRLMVLHFCSPRDQPAQQSELLWQAVYKASDVGFREILIFADKYDCLNPKVLGPVLLQAITNYLGLADVARGSSLVRVKITQRDGMSFDQACGALSQFHCAVMSTAVQSYCRKHTLDSLIVISCGMLMN